MDWLVLELDNATSKDEALIEEYHAFFYVSLELQPDIRHHSSHHTHHHTHHRTTRHNHHSIHVNAMVSFQSVFFHV